MLGFLLIWAIEQVAWVYSDSGNEACYEAFDVKGLYSLLTAIIVAIAVVSVTFGECASRVARCRPNHYCADVVFAARVAEDGRCFDCFSDLRTLPWRRLPRANAGGQFPPLF